MVFTLLPSVDVADGRRVRLVRGQVVAGRGNELSIGSDHPLDTARAWQVDGASWVHLVDVDAAFGRGSNIELLASMIRELDLDVQLSGGIRDEATLSSALSTGCGRVVLATTALADLAWCERAIDEHGDRIAIGLDVRVVEHADGSIHHRLAARGDDLDRGDLWDTIDRLDRAGCARYVVADAGRDGTLTGPDCALYETVTAITETPVVASGGVSSIDDLIALARTGKLEGSIVGSALHTGRFVLREAMSVLGEVSGPDVEHRDV